MADKKLLKIGVVGTVISAICCFTPLLVVTFAALGASSLLGLADYVLLPSLVMFSGLMIFAFMRKTAK